VASRRLRELLPVLQLEGELADRLGRRLRRVTRTLAPVRDLDVLLELIGRLRASRRYERDALVRVTAELATQRETAMTKVRAKRAAGDLRWIGAKLEKISRRLVELPGGRQTTRGWRWAVDARVGRRATAVRSALDVAGAVYLPDRVHAVRIAVKKLRYAVELQGEVSTDPGWRESLATLKRTQALLGRLNDRQVLLDRVRQIQASLSPPTIEGWRCLDTLVGALEQDCRRLHARYLRDAPALAAVCAGMVTPGPSSGSRVRTGASRRRAG
jgi:CHAD domain-containing protein